MEGVAGLNLNLGLLTPDSMYFPTFPCALGPRCGA